MRALAINGWMRWPGRARAVAVRACGTIVSLLFSPPVNGVEPRSADDGATCETSDRRAHVSPGQHRDGVVQGLLLEAVDGIRQASDLTVDAEARAALNAHADDVARFADVAIRNGGRLKGWQAARTAEPVASHINPAHRAKFMFRTK